MHHAPLALLGSSSMLARARSEQARACLPRRSQLGAFGTGARAFAAWVVALGVAGCASEATGTRATAMWTEPTSGTTYPPSGMMVEDYFPMRDGHIFQYDTLNEQNDTGLLAVRVKRDDPFRGSFRYPSGSKVFEYRSDGLFSVTANVYVLKTPFEVGTTWKGEGGSTVKLTAMNTIVNTPAGRFENCVQTLEERAGDRPMRLGTTYCPGVGVALLEAASGASFETASLKYHGAAVPIGPDGVTKQSGP